MRAIRYPIPPAAEGWTVERFLREEGFSGRMLTALRKLPLGLLLNGAHIRTVDLLSPGDLLEVNLPGETKRMPTCSIPVPILYEDEDVIRCYLEELLHILVWGRDGPSGLPAWEQ